MKWWWLSFVHEELPIGQKGVGVAVVEAEDFTAAINEAWHLGINPGGEVAAWEFPMTPPLEVRNRFFKREEVPELEKAIRGTVQ